jgi:hypothetical protein
LFRCIGGVKVAQLDLLLSKFASPQRGDDQESIEDSPIETAVREGRNQGDQKNVGS